MARRLAHWRTQASFARQAQVSVSAQNAGASAHSAGADSHTLFSHPNEEQTMKTGIRMAVAMLAAVSSGAMAAPFSVSSNDMRDGQPLAQQHWFAGFGCTGGNVSPQLAWKTPRRARAASRSPSGIPMRLPAAAGGTGRWSISPAASFRCLLAREIKTALHCRAERSRPQRFWLCRLRRRLSAGGR